MTLEEKIAETLIDFAKSFENGDTLDTSEYVQRIAQALSGICVECLELEWEDSPEYVRVSAKTPFGKYIASGYGASFRAWKNATECLPATPITGDILGDFYTLEAAQQACQADFSSRWASCAKTRTVEEVRREYLEELIAEADRSDGPLFLRWLEDDEFDPATVRCWLRLLQQEGKTDA